MTFVVYYLIFPSECESTREAGCLQTLSPVSSTCFHSESTRDWGFLFSVSTRKFLLFLVCIFPWVGVSEQLGVPAMSLITQSRRTCSMRRATNICDHNRLNVFLISKYRPFLINKRSSRRNLPSAQELPYNRSSNVGNCTHGTCLRITVVTSIGVFRNAMHGRRTDETNTSVSNSSYVFSSDLRVLILLLLFVSYESSSSASRREVK